jgi:hypothetical protein
MSIEQILADARQAQQEIANEGMTRLQQHADYQREKLQEQLALTKAQKDAIRALAQK